MKKISVITFILCAFLCNSCNVFKTDFFSSYITVYYQYDNNIDLEINDSNQIVIGSGELVNQFRYSSKGREKEIFDSLSVAHNDVGFNREMTYYPAPDWGRCYQSVLLV